MQSRKTISPIRLDIKIKYEREIKSMNIKVTQNFVYMYNFAYIYNAKLPNEITGVASTRPIHSYHKPKKKKKKIGYEEQSLYIHAQSTT